MKKLTTGMEILVIVITFIYVIVNVVYWGNILPLEWLGFLIMSFSQVPALMATPLALFCIYRRLKTPNIT